MIEVLARQLYAHDRWTQEDRDILRDHAQVRLTMVAHDRLDAALMFSLVDSRVVADARDPPL